MFPLRYPKLWLALGWLLVAGVVIGSLMPGDMLSDFDLSDKVMHSASYFVLMLWFGGLYRRGFHPLIALVLLSLGMGLDVLQGFTRTRSFDLRDVAANFGGIVVGLALTFWVLEGWCQRLERRVLSLA